MLVKFDKKLSYVVPSGERGPDRLDLEGSFSPRSFIQFAKVELLIPFLLQKA